MTMWRGAYGNYFARLYPMVLETGLKPRRDAVDEIMSMVREETVNGFARFQGLHEVIGQYYREAMVPFLNAIPPMRDEAYSASEERKSE